MTPLHGWRLCITLTNLVPFDFRPLRFDQGLHWVKFSGEVINSAGGRGTLSWVM